MAVAKEKANGKNNAPAKEKSPSEKKSTFKDRGPREQHGNPVTSRIVPEAAVVAAKAMVGNSCTDELAVEIVEVVRVHVEYPYAAYIAQLHEEITEARAEIARLQNA